ncbi:polysaccharide biosynthesis C-terminal domain-containing protein [Cysteiniphilum sp. QT6929]|uniref:oligosaccharide flippase family protein n=1 Tax=Cysteiniphilum sp. QT6929 TaxID=2975055 RepID=UPI0024B382A4|nr:polysaccharide biosynthesis C-terminal domain-containing protein [Cysteiniphilum sp. QT6929]WHN65821.1 polysaccharide biosynthesis C-terminal domain-containing protein [Cysteiniphilum sp. QT6929]
MHLMMLTVKVKKLLHNEILIKSLGTMFVQGLGQMTAFASAILLAHYLTVSEYGQYMFGVTIATISAVIATLGADGILARSWGWSSNNGVTRTKEVFQLHNWFWRRGILILIFACIGCFSYIYLFDRNASFIEVFAFLFALPFFIANLLQSFYVANKKVIYANLIQFIMRLIMLLIIGIYIVIEIHNAPLLVGSMLAAITLYMFILWLKISVKHGFKSHKPQGSNLSFMLLKWGNLLLSQIDIVLLKIFSNNESIAYYAVALQLSALVVFVLNAVSANIMAQVANDYKMLSRDAFQTKITEYTRIICGLSALGMVALIIAGYWITILYGQAYTQAYSLFCVLMIGQAVNVLCGSVFTILNMAGFEKTTCRVFYIALVINIVLGIALIPSLHAFGVAIASAIAMIFWNLVLTYFVIKKLGVNPTIFTFIHKQC